MRQSSSQQTSTDWQGRFLEMLPSIQQKLQLAFCRLDDEAREDATAEALVHCLLAYVRLDERGRVEAVSASTLAWYSSRQVKRGRLAVGRLNGQEPLSRYAQIGNGFQRELRHSRWLDALVADKRATVPDQVAAKIDIGAWFATLSQRMQQIAKDLAYGFSTKQVAQKYGVTPGRISQLRRSLKQSWEAFQGEAVTAL